MKEILLAACVALGGTAIFTTISAVKYKYPFSTLRNQDFTPVERPIAESPQREPLSPDVIYEKDAFDVKRGQAEEIDESENTDAVVATGNYTFQFRGVIGVGKSQVVLFSATLNSRSSSKGRSPTRSTVTNSSDKLHICKLGDRIAESDFTVAKIEGNTADIKDSKGNTQSFSFSLSSEESLKRREVAFKAELSRQKAYAKQNTFQTPTKTKTNSTPPKLTAEQAAKKREVEMRARAEMLKQEMKRLKEMRENKDSKSKSSSKSKKSK